MTTQTAISPAGIFLLASIREILELAGVADAIESGELCPKLLEFSPQEYREPVPISLLNKDGYKSVPLVPADDHPGFDMSIRKALNEHMCPIVSVTANNGVGNHAMCAYKLAHELIFMKNSNHKKGCMDIPITRREGDTQFCQEALYIKFVLGK